MTRAAKGPQLRWPAKRAKSSGNQAGGALGNGRAGPGQGGKAPGEQALTVTAGNSVFLPFGPRETVPIQAGLRKKNNPLTVSKLFFFRAAGAARLQQGARAILREQGELVRQVRLMLGHVAIPRVQAKFAKSPCCRFGTGSRGGAVGDAVCAKAVTDRSWAVFFARCFVC